jgi:hypothetical protein
MFKKTLIFCFILSALSLTVPVMAAPITSITLLSVLHKDKGDLTVLLPPGAGDTTLDNGIDEWTRGTFDFRGNAAYSAFHDLLGLPHGKILAATLTLALKPEDNLFTTDQINLDNGPFVGPADPVTGISPIGQLILGALSNPSDALDITKVITIDLLDFYSQQQLEESVDDGVIVFTYGDDAIVSGAQLQLTAYIPEPGTLALLSLSLLAAFAAASRKNSEHRR